LSALHVILPLLASGDVATRRRAVEALGIARDRAGLGNLMERAIQDPELEVREQAIDELVALDGVTQAEVEPVTAVMNRLLEDQGSRIAAYAAWGRLSRAGFPIGSPSISISAHLRNTLALVRLYREAFKSRVGRIFFPAFFGALIFTILANLVVIAVADPTMSSGGPRFALMSIFFNVPLSVLLVVLGGSFQVAWGLYPSRAMGFLAESAMAAGVGALQGMALGAIFAPFLIAACPNEATFAQYGLGMSAGAVAGGAVGLVLRTGAVSGYGTVGWPASARLLGIASSLSLLILGLYATFRFAIDEEAVRTFLQSRALWIFLIGGAVAAGQASASAELDQRQSSAKILRSVPWIGIALILAASVTIFANLQALSHSIESLYPQINKPPRCLDSKESAPAR
jgi:hypothetical protein